MTVSLPTQSSPFIGRDCSPVSRPQLQITNAGRSGWRNIYGKLGVNSRTQAIAHAQKLSLM